MSDDVVTGASGGGAASRRKHVLITLLGGANPKGYREAHYVFPDGRKCTSQYFGLALADYLKAIGKKADKIVVIGTNGSFWDNLIKLLIPESDPAKLADMADKGKSHAVKDADLDCWREQLTEGLRARYDIEEIDPIINDYAETPEQQLRLISSIDRIVKDSGRITFDVTHALRHLSMLSLLSALVVHRLRTIPIEIYYGALDLTKDDKTPVLMLDGLLHIMDWLAALNSYDKDGDYAAFAPLLEALPGGKAGAGMLRNAAYYEYMGNFGAAADNLRAYRNRPYRPGGSDPMMIFSEALEQRFAWIDQTPLYDRQRRQTFLVLQRGDFLRAAIWGTEALVSRLAKRMGRSPQDTAIRDRICDDWDAAFTAAGLTAAREKFVLLKGIRNRLAHAFQGRRSQQVKEAMKNRETCMQALSQCFEVLLPENP